MSGNTIITRGFGEFDLILSRGYVLCQFNFLDYTPEIIDVRYAYLTKPNVSINNNINTPTTIGTLMQVRQPVMNNIIDTKTKPDIKVNKSLTKPKGLKGKYRRKDYYVDSY
jgi:hypothetical protein